MAGPSNARGKSILYVCDDVVLGDTRARVLQGEGYDVIVAGDVQGARRLWRNLREPFDLVLFEISGDIRPALEMCEEIKSERREQLYAILASTRTYLSRASCPD